MPYLYQSTHVLNLPSIKQHGLAPLKLRPAGIAQGATARDRAENEATKLEDKILSLLYTCFKKGYSIERVIANPGAEIALKEVTITGNIEYPDAIPVRMDIQDLDATTEAYLNDYWKLLGDPVPGQSALLKTLGMDSPVEFKKKFRTPARAFQAVMPRHFITQLAIRYIRTYYDAEFRITSEHIYFFKDAHFSKGYAGYAKIIAGSVMANVAILRVDQDHCGELKPDSAQADALTSKNTKIPAEHIAYAIGIPVPTVVSGEIFRDGYWNRLSKYNA